MARRTVLLGLLLALAMSLLPASGAQAQAQPSADSPEQELAERYAPIVMIKAQEEECDRDGEAFARWRSTRSSTTRRSRCARSATTTRR